MKNIGILTGTRAEYGLLKPVMQKVEQDKDLNLCLIVTGMHLSDQFFLYGTPEYTPVSYTHLTLPTTSRV